MKPPSLVVQIDRREQSPWRWPGVETEPATLAHADYRIRGFPEAVIERKSLPDFIGSTCSAERPRFWRELSALRSYAFAAVVIEGSAEDVFATAYRSLASPESVWASGLAIQIDHGVHVIWAGDRERASKTALWLLTRWATRSRLRRNDAWKFARRQSPRKVRRA